jgi:hypothetical protein
MKIIQVDFQNQKIINIEQITPVEEKLDPVLQRIKNKIDPQWFDTYKKTIEHYWEECFLYQMEKLNGKMYDSQGVE